MLINTLLSGLAATVLVQPGRAAGSGLTASRDKCAFEPQAKVADACASYAYLEELNDVVHDSVRNLVTKTDFFSYYRLNLYNKVCPFWLDESGLCGNIACAVTTLENEEDIPKIWRAEELSKLEGPKAHHPGKVEQAAHPDKPLQGELGADVGESCVVEYDDECDERDYCVPEDESASAKGDYVSLVDNPERFTGYAGPGARQVWDAIYRENCFSKPQQSTTSSRSNVMGAGLGSKQPLQAALDLKAVMRDHGRHHAGSTIEEQLEFDDECIEKRVFYRVISGMHASISTHLCHDYLNQTTGKWGPNLQCYRERLHNHPERVSNLYFNYALVLRAVNKLKDHIQDYTFCTGDPVEDSKTKRIVQTLAKALPGGPELFDESILFQDKVSVEVASGLTLREDFRNRFRNISRIMDCVGCDKCRLWGKLQTAGYGTALKVLFEFGHDDGHSPRPLLRRTELVALLNTLDKIGHAIRALAEFRGMLAEEEAGGLPSTTLPAPIDDGDDDRGKVEDHTEYKQPSLMDDIRHEVRNVWRVYLLVLRHWASLPQTLWLVVSDELGRVYKSFIGLPVGPRAWEFRAPNLDEL